MEGLIESARLGMLCNSGAQNTRSQEVPLSTTNMHL